MNDNATPARSDMSKQNYHSYDLPEDLQNVEPFQSTNYGVFGDRIKSPREKLLAETEPNELSNQFMQGMNEQHYVSFNPQWDNPSHNTINYAGGVDGDLVGTQSNFGMISEGAVDQYPGDYDCRGYRIEASVSSVEDASVGATEEKIYTNLQNIVCEAEVPLMQVRFVYIFLMIITSVISISQQK